MLEGCATCDEYQAQLCRWVWVWGFAHNPMYLAVVADYTAHVKAAHQGE